MKKRVLALLTVLCGLLTLEVGSRAVAQREGMREGDQRVQTDDPRRAPTRQPRASSPLPPASGAPETQHELSRLWQDVRGLIRQAAYREALQRLELIAARAPGDPMVELYRALCERRLQVSAPIPQRSEESLRELQQRLEQEELARRRAVAMQRALDQQARREQAQWDQELKTLQREAQRQAKLQRMRDRVAAPARPNAAPQVAPPPPAPLPPQQVERLPHSIPPPSPTASVPAPAPETPTRGSSPEQPPVTRVSQEPGEAPSATAPPTAEPAVELEPVAVPTTSPAAPSRAPQPPQILQRPKPPAGAVQINARQMHVLQERRLAVAEGDVEVLFGNAILQCDRLTLFTDTKDLYAEGRVRLEEGPQVFRGELMHYNIDAEKGRFLQGTMSFPPWYEHGRSVAHLAEGVYQVKPGSVTSCELDPPHFRFAGRRAMVFGDDQIVRGSNVTLFAEQFPLIYLPWLSVAERQSPFFIIPGKKKPWEEFALMGYRYEWPEGHHGTLRGDWRRAFGWATGIDHQFNTTSLGKGLLRLYYNKRRYIRVKEDDLPRGASINRYRLLWRHKWQPWPATSLVTDIQKLSDKNFRKELLFRDEFVEDDNSETSLSLVNANRFFSVTALLRQRMNRFETVTEAYPDATFTMASRPVGETPLYYNLEGGVANLQTKQAHSDNDADVVRLDWFEQLRYALNWFRPILVTPRAGVRHVYYTKDKQGGSERPDGRRDLLSGQFTTGADASLKLFRIFPVSTNALGLDINWLRHVLTPTVAYTYAHRPTVPSGSLSFAKADGPTNGLSVGLENKLQTRRRKGKGKPQGVDIARFVTSLPYTFRGNHNKQGGRLGDWAFDLELFPWPWLRLETDWAYPSHFLKGSRDRRIPTWNLDLVMVGGHPDASAKNAPGIAAPALRAFEAGPKAFLGLMPPGEWYLGFGNRYSQNDKTESVIEFDWAPSSKWEIGTFHRFTWKEVGGGGKRFSNIREYQYRLRRDLHDWWAEVVYRVDREFGEEFFFTLTLKAYPQLPIEIAESYHEPKFGSQGGPFSPLRGEHQPTRPPAPAVQPSAGSSS